MKFFYILMCLVFSAFTYAQNERIAYSYDSHNRIKTASFPNGNSETYYYDRVGNRISQINVSVSIKNINADFGEFKVYPNPTDGLFNISGKAQDQQDFEISLIDNQGKEITKMTVANTVEFSKELNIGSRASGTYSLILKTKNGSRSWTVVKL